MSDLKHARSYIIPLGAEDRMAEIARQLNKVKGYFKGEVGHRVRLKYVPESLFRAG